MRALCVHFISFFFFACENEVIDFSLQFTAARLESFRNRALAINYKKKRKYFKELLKVHLIIVELIIVQTLTLYRLTGDFLVICFFVHNFVGTPMFYILLGKLVKQ